MTNKLDPTTLLDSSATMSCDPDCLKNAGNGLGHDYHQLASQCRRLDAAEDKPGGANQNYREPDTTKTSKVGRSRHDADKVAPKINTVSTLDNTTETSWNAYFPTMST